MAGTRNYDFLVGIPGHLESTHFSIQLTVMLADKTTSHRRFRRWEIVLLAPVQRGLLHTFLHHHNRHRLQDPHHRLGREEGQAADMGYGGPGTVQDDHNSILSWCDGYITGLRCHR